MVAIGVWRQGDVRDARDLVQGRKVLQVIHHSIARYAHSHTVGWEIKQIICWIITNVAITVSSLFGCVCICVCS